MASSEAVPKSGEPAARVRWPAEDELGEVGWTASAVERDDSGPDGVNDDDQGRGRVGREP